VKFLSRIKTLLSPEKASAPLTLPEQPGVDDEYFPDPVEIEITDVFDLHSIPPKQVTAVVEEYLLIARQKGFASVRIIHGKGIGVQREVVRSILARTPFVFDWTDAPPGAGGLGATIVRLKPVA
jgi:DNA-nicking Smr family endonuclease